MQQASSTLVFAIVLHLIADWLFQNDWMTRNKVNLKHPAAWVHGAIHFVFLLPVFSLSLSISIAVIHMLIDTRLPMKLWQQFYKQTTEGVYAIPVAIWADQVLHITVLALAALLSAASA